MVNNIFIKNKYMAINGIGRPINLTINQELEIVDLYNKKVSKIKLSKKFNVGRKAINKVLNKYNVVQRVANQHKIDLTGDRYGRLLVLKKSERKAILNRTIYICLCDCGTICETQRANLVNRTTNSCGCLNQEKRRDRLYKHGKSNDLEGRMFYSAKSRAKERGIEFNLDISDIVIPELCPILNIPLFKNKNGVQSNNSPSLDRINPKLGYIKGNVKVISAKANRLKDESTIEDLEKIIDYIKQNTILNE